MHTRASNSELVEPLPELEHILQNYDPMDDEPMWVASRVVVLTPGSAITIPETANEFAIKGNHLTHIKGNQFDGRTKTDPHKHIHKFLRICDMFKYRDTENEVEMLRNCHGHNLSKGNIIKIFYDGLNEITQEVLNAAAGGIFLYKTSNIAYHLLEEKVLLKLDWAKNQKAKSSLKKTVAFATEDFADKQSGRPSGSLPSNTQPNPKDSSSKPYQPPQARNEHVNAVFKWSGKSYDPPNNPNDQQNHSETPINFDSDDENDEPTPQPKPKTPKTVKETTIPKSYKSKILYPQRLKKEKMEAQYGKFHDMIRAVRINVPLVDVLAGMPKYGKFFKELINNKHKIKQISVAFLSDESSAILQNKVPPKLGDPEVFSFHVISTKLSHAML
ncbi:hypothetical protein Tco_1062757 [Tanacetum coccineum]